MTTLSTHVSRSNGPASDATSFMRAPGKETFMVRVFDALVKKKRITSPRRTASRYAGSPFTRNRLPNRPMSAWVGELRPGRDRDQRPGLLAVEPVHRGILSVEVAPHEAGLEPGRVAIAEPQPLSRTRVRWRPGRPVRRDLGSERHLGREHGQPAWHRNDGPSQAVPRSVRVAVRVMPHAGRLAHRPDRELE